jgi:hypothetical protein
MTTPSDIIPVIIQENQREVNHSLYVIRPLVRS